MAASVVTFAAGALMGATVLQPWPGDGLLAGCWVSGICTGANCEDCTGCDISGVGVAAVVHLSAGREELTGSPAAGAVTGVNGVVC